MAAYFNTLPDEIVEGIVTNCSAKELVALARTCKRLSRIAVADLYRHVYYRHVEMCDAQHQPEDFDQSGDTNSHPPVYVKRPHTERSWRCSQCFRKCSDGVFQDERPSSTWIVDLIKFAQVLSQRQDRKTLVRTVRLDLQSRHGWGDEFPMHPFIEPDTEMWRWSVDMRLQGAIQLMTDSLSHLPLSRALFLSKCFDGCDNPRVIQTMGMSLPFLLVIPDFAIQSKQPRTGHPHLPTNSNSFDVETSLEFDIARIDHTSHPPQVVEIEDIEIKEFSFTSIRYYSGPLMGLGDLLGAPHDFNSYRNWLAMQPPEAFQTNSIKATIMRQVQEHFKSLAKRHQQSTAFEFDSQVIGDVSNLCLDNQLIVKTQPRSRGHPLPENILLHHLELDLVEYV